MYLLDTNHCSRLMEDDAIVVSALRAKGGALVATSVIVQGELRFMASHSARPADNLRRVRTVVQSIHLYGIDEATAEVYGDLKAGVYARFGPREKAKRRHVRIQDLGFSDNELWIAATAIRHGLTLVSADSDFRRMAEAVPLALETWWTPSA